MIKPAEMTKIHIVGVKDDLKTVIERLHSMQVLDIESYDGELETGESLEEAEDISEMLVDLRSLLSKLPETEESSGEKEFSQVESQVSSLNEEVNNIEESLGGIQSRISELEDNREFFEKLVGLDLEYEDLEGTRELECFIGRIDEEKLREEMPTDRFEVFSSGETKAVFYQDDDDHRGAVEKASVEDFGLLEGDFEGTPSEIVEDIEEKIESVREERGELEEELEDISKEWRSDLEDAEDFLTEKVEKAEAPIEFGTTENTFVAEGWIPGERYEDIEEELAEITEGKIHVERGEGGEPPVKHDNRGPVKPFESLTDLMSVPKYNEIDPSVVIFLTFPLFFGFMIGDAGYGITSMIVFYLGYRMFSGAEDIFKSLMYASVATIFFGLIYGDMFGFIIFGHESKLAEVTGLHIFEQIPVLYHRSHHWGQVFQISALIGLIHINAGYLIGFYNDYVHHGVVDAFLEKGSWLVLEAGIALWLLVGATAGAPVVALSVALLYLGEGIAGVIEIPSLLSNVLSYLRLFGVSVAAFSLAKVVNSFADPLFATGTLLGLLGGILMLMVGHTFNTFIKIMEGFLQGIRLHYVEMFSKFYEGGGRKYVPFGSDVS